MTARMPMPPARSGRSGWIASTSKSNAPVLGVADLLARALHEAADDV
jgi:hypothetical protein